MAEAYICSLSKVQRHAEICKEINKLYELLLTRLNVIKECWDVSVASADPKKDAKAILAPLSKDIKGGKSSSMADFDALYPQVVLIKASS